MRVRLAAISACILTLSLRYYDFNRRASVSIGGAQTRYCASLTAESSGAGLSLLGTLIPAAKNAGSKARCKLMPTQHGLTQAAIGMFIS